MWAEDSEAPTQPPVRRGRRPAKQTHPFAVSARTLAATTAREGTPGTAVLALPNQGRGPSGRCPTAQIRRSRVLGVAEAEVAAAVGGRPKPPEGVPSATAAHGGARTGLDDCVKNGPVVLPVRAEVVALSSELQRLRDENARLTRLLDLRGWDTAPAPEQPSMPVTSPGMVTKDSSLEDKLALYADRFRARRDVYAVRWENSRSGLSGWSPAVAGGWRKGMDPRGARYLPLTAGGAVGAFVRPGICRSVSVDEGQ